MPQILALYLDYEGGKTSISLNSRFWALEDTGGSWLWLKNWSWFWYGHWSLVHQCSEFCVYLDLKVQRTLMSLKSSFWALGDAGGSWLGFGILILTGTWSLVFDTPMIQIFREDPSKVPDHIKIKTRKPNPNQEPPATPNSPIQDVKDINVLCTFKIKIASQNLDHWCIKDQ